MPIIGAFHWYTAHRHINYMIIDKETLQVKLGPVVIPVPDENYVRTIDEAINAFFTELENSAEYDDDIVIEYKTYIKSAYAPIEQSEMIDSKFVHKLHNYAVSQNHVHKLKKLLEKSDRKLFKDALKTALAKKSLSKEEVDLWNIALHATPGNVDKVVGMLEKNSAH